MGAIKEAGKACLKWFLFAFIGAVIAGLLAGPTGGISIIVYLALVLGKLA